MAYAQWVEIKVYAENMKLTVKNVSLEWGKFYRQGNKDDEISKNAIDGMSISSGNPGIICACGRSDASSGTEGSFELYNGNDYVGKYYWDCPWGSKNNKSVWSPTTSVNYKTSIEGGSLNSGAIGNVYITCIKVK
ncbi:MULTISPECIES: aegerolysin family protein [unclassified Brenneria]|uniref:aegerolysin family protein n=1 Tax=unclassified Brenneria TaxID=2634434 RepID=UPI0018F105F3|nr:aegerolysin family protein [Brenneria sp. L3-3C-1]MBJ7221258.1 aegerolysin family protein [Brenneria sp. L3-3C-1]MEE3642502.1 aegerolysin family protein [Brenneria sp. L3_3C_1]